jgi:hypothetical protein
MKSTVCTLLLATAALTGCSSDRSHSHECCAEQRFYPQGTMMPPGAQRTMGNIAPAGYREAQAAAGYAPGPTPSPQYPAMPQHFSAAQQHAGQAFAR